MHFFVLVQRLGELQGAAKLDLSQICKRKRPGRCHDSEKVFDEFIPFFQVHSGKRLIHRFLEQCAARTQRFRAHKRSAEHFPGKTVMCFGAEAVAYDDFRIFSLLRYPSCFRKSSRKPGPSKLYTLIIRSCRFCGSIEAAYTARFPPLECPQTIKLPS